MKQLSLCIIALLAALMATSALAGTIQVPQTGQTTCWNESGGVIPCANTGQTGDKLIGAALPTPRFTDNGNGSMTDNLTGLIWLQNANCSATLGGVVKTTSLTWQNAITWSNALASGSCGLTDGSTAGQWRLPNVNELESLFNRQQTNIATWLNSQGFTGVQSLYWSASTYANNPAGAWIVSMGNGNMTSDVKTNGRYLWPVRAGQ